MTPTRALILAAILLGSVSIAVSAQAPVPPCAVWSNAERRCLQEAAPQVADCVVWSHAENRCLDAPKAIVEAPNLGLTPAEIAGIDRTKFDKVYAASVAMVASGYAVKRTPLAQQAMLAFDTEATIALAKAATKGEEALAKKYVEAQWKYELKTDRVWPLEKWKEGLADATDALDAANTIYLWKKK